MKIYTRTGDSGDTGLFGGERVRKNDLRVEAYGTLDELNAALGFVRAQTPTLDISTCLERIQGELFTVGAELACAPSHLPRLRMPLVDATHIDQLEKDIDAHESKLPALQTFILPTGSPAGASLHLARTVCRRAERRCLDLSELRSEILIYLNRLSDLLFVLARRQNQDDETPETPWSGRHSM